MSESAPLLPCPFCGNQKIELAYGPTANAPYMYCESYSRQKKIGCGIGGPYANNEKEAREAWNRRPSSARREAEKKVIEAAKAWYSVKFDYSTKARPRNKESARLESILWDAIAALGQEGK